LPEKKTTPNLHQQNSSEDHSASPEPDQMEESDEVKDQGDDESEVEASAGEDDDRTPCMMCFRKCQRVKSHLVKVCSHFLTSQVQGLMMHEEYYRKPQFLGYFLYSPIVHGALLFRV